MRPTAEPHTLLPGGSRPTIRRVRWHWYVRGWAAVVLAVAALIGVIAGSLPTSTPRTSGALSSHRPGQASSPAAVREQDVAGLLRKRAMALRNRDITTFMSTVDPLSTPDFQGRQRRMFDNLAGVPLSEWTYQIRTGTWKNPSAPPRLLAPADEIYSPPVDLRYGLAGVDVVPTSRETGLMFTRRGASWYVADEGDGNPDDQRSWRGPWDFGPSTVMRTATGLVIGHQGNRDLAQRVTRALDASVGAVTQVWGPQWTRRVAILLPDSQLELQAMVGPEFAVDGIAAVAVADRVDTDSRRVEGPRIVLNPKTSSQLPDSALEVVLRHEITHIASRADTVDGAPMWLLEGFADYVGYRNSGIAPADIAPDLIRQFRQHKPATLPPDVDFHLSGRTLDLAYQQSWSMVDFLARHWGQQRVVEFYRRVGRSGTPATVDRALREMTGMGTTEVLQAWNADLHRSFG